MHGSRHAGEPPALRVRTADGQEFRFARPFHVGRGDDCDVRIDDVHVSRRHIVVSCNEGLWSFSDLQSSNGVFVNQKRVLTALVAPNLSVRLGAVDGPLLTMEVETPAAAATERYATTPGVPEGGGQTRMIADYAERYFGSAKINEPVGKRTMMIRKAFRQVQKKQRRVFGWVVAALALLTVIAGGYGVYQRQRVVRQQALAEELFYSMKALDVDIANLERTTAASGSQSDRDQVKRYYERRREMEANYDTFLSGLNIYGRNLTEEERLILRVTRMFGECELIAPREYLSEVATYIRRWQATGRYVRAVTLAQEKGYTRKIAEEFIQRNLPPQFFYLAMQESDFDPLRSGPPTSFGIAKGMWQFIPETGLRYGLSIGPLARFERPDLADDRSNWEKATGAAARYIKDIYATDAQASGLLVMASYNWGEGRVVRLLRQMPANPRERNFWKLLEKYRSQVPSQTYDYVFYIVSAAVIGENPRLFGFPFDSPLQSIVKP